MWGNTQYFTILYLGCWGPSTNREYSTRDFQKWFLRQYAFMSFWYTLCFVIIISMTRVFQSKNLGGGGQIGKNRQKSRENERISKNCQKLHENERILGPWTLVCGGDFGVFGIHNPDNSSQTLITDTVTEDLKQSLQPTTVHATDNSPGDRQQSLHQPQSDSCSCDWQNSLQSMTAVPVFSDSPCVQYQYHGGMQWLGKIKFGPDHFLP